MENNANKAYPWLLLKVTGTVVLNAGEKRGLFNSYFNTNFSFFLFGQGE